MREGVSPEWLPEGENVDALPFAVFLVGEMCVLTLLLPLGVIRRPRQDADSPARRAGAPPGPPMAAVGTPVRHPAVAGDGEILVGFFTPGCGPCEQQAPDFIKYARTRDRVVAVVLDPAGDAKKGEARELVQKLEQVAQVVVEDSPEGALHKAFEVRGYPSYCVVRDGFIALVAGRAADLAAQEARIPA